MANEELARLREILNGEPDAKLAWKIAIELLDELEKARADFEAANSTFEDEQAAHQDTLRLLEQAKDHP